MTEHYDRSISEIGWEQRAVELAAAVRSNLSQEMGRQPTDREVHRLLDNQDLLRAYSGGRYDLLADGAKAEATRLVAVLASERGLS